MPAWIMVDSSGMPYTKNMYDLYKGFTELGEDVKTFTAADIFSSNIPVSENDIFVGHIHRCKEHVYKICGKTPIDLDYPLELQPFMLRKILHFTIGALYDMVTKSTDGDIGPIFVKSKEQKLITGFICDGFSSFVKNCTGFDRNVELYCSEAVKFRSEYRVYIHRHSIVDVLKYKGDYDVAPSRYVIDSMLKSVSNVKMPIAYSIDVGVLENGATVLVECNDGFALGNYGINSRIYAEMHRDRWYQMIHE